jgi:hypothetical protein
MELYRCPLWAIFCRLHPRNFTTAYININSIRNNYDEIKELLSDKIVDLLFIAETKLDQSSSSLFTPEVLFIVVSLSGVFDLSTLVSSNSVLQSLIHETWKIILHDLEYGLEQNALETQICFSWSTLIIRIGSIYFTRRYINIYGGELAYYMFYTVEIVTLHKTKQKHNTICVGHHFT